MDEFEFLRDITIGLYLPERSLLHRLDPRAKLLALIALIAAVTFTSTYLGNAVLLMSIAGLVALGRVPLRFALSGLRPALPFILALALLQLLFISPSLAASPVLFSVGPAVITEAGLRLVVVSIARFVELYFLVSLLTCTTTTTELAHGVESLLSPLAVLRFPAHEVALALTIALRFVPIIAQETERLMKAQVSRGADFGGGSRWRFIERTRRMIPLFVPLFISALNRADELVIAMEARGYLGGRGRTRFVELRATSRDYVAVLAAVAFAAAVLLFPFSS